MSLNLLNEHLAKIPKENYPHHSRVHRLSSFDFGKAKVFIKRDDELGFGISGSKLRKYLTLIPYIKSEAPDEVIVIGSAFSNHVLALGQLLKELRICPVYFLLSFPSPSLKGNFLWTSLLAGQNDIRLISKEDWKEIDLITKRYIEKRSTEHKKVISIPSGGSKKESLPGALTLPLDILRNEDEIGISWDHIFIDSGTGMMAHAVILAFAYLKKNTQLHIVQMAGSRESFHDSLQVRTAEFEELMGQKINLEHGFNLYTPKNAPSFGSVNSKVFRAIAEMAQQEGIFTDPIYTAKLFSEGKQIIKDLSIRGNILFIHSGGGLALSGFQEKLSKFVGKKHNNAYSAEQ
jgi:1-aminocyclopropane-1-carboxylate deaminase